MNVAVADGFSTLIVHMNRNNPDVLDNVIYKLEIIYFSVYQRLYKC